MVLRAMNQQASKAIFIKSFIGLAAVAALLAGVWFGIQNTKTKEIPSNQVSHVEKSNRSSPSSSEVKEVSFLLPMALLNTGGESFQVSEKLGKLTLVNFWATWCAPCREEMPVFNAVFQKNQKKGFVVLGLTIDNPESTEKFIQQLGIVYPVLMAEDEGWDLLGKTGNPKNLMPYSFLIDEKGVVLEQRLGTLHGDELQGWIDKYL